MTGYDEKIRKQLAWEHFWKLSGYLLIALSEENITESTYGHLDYSLSFLKPEDETS